MSNKSEIAEQEATFEAEDSVALSPPPEIVAYNELRSCADLFRLHSSGKMELQPGFQREVVWKPDDQTRFIDSLVKQLPIPSMCFSLDHKTQRWKVIDGLQRMTTIIRFLSTSEWKLNELSDIHPRLRNATNLDLRNGDEEQRRLFSMVEDVSIPLTVIRCDYTKKGHMRYLFTIFHRLNSGGMRLTNQEIRNCIYTGEFNDLLKTFDHENSAWRLVRRRIWGPMDRFRSIEVLLRVMAFGDRLAVYDGNLARFLNDYMTDKTAEPATGLSGLNEHLASVAQMAQRTLSVEIHGKVSLTVIEAVLVALYVNVMKLKSATDEELQSLYQTLKEQPSFAENARYAISSAENVRARLGAAINTFAR